MAMQKRKVDGEYITGMGFELEQEDIEEMTEDYLAKKGIPVPKDEDYEIDLFSEGDGEATISVTKEKK